MAVREKPHATGKVKAGDVTERVGVEQVAARGVDVPQLIEKLIDAAGADLALREQERPIRLRQLDRCPRKEQDVAFFQRAAVFQLRGLAGPNGVHGDDWHDSHLHAPRRDQDRPGRLYHLEPPSLSR
jgi:hypothetical protein